MGWLVQGSSELALADILKLLVVFLSSENNRLAGRGLSDPEEGKLQEARAALLNIVK
jgi:hypothetical protein